MKLTVLIVALTALPFSKCGKNQTKRAILGSGNHNLVSIEKSVDYDNNPNQNAYLPPPIQEYPIEKSIQSFQQSSSGSVVGIEPPSTNYLPPHISSPSQEHYQATPSGFVPINNVIGNNLQLQPAAQYRAPDYLPPRPDQQRTNSIPGLTTPVESNSKSHSLYKAPEYLPPLHDSEPAISQAYKAPDYLPPDNHVPTNHIDTNSYFSAPGYLPPFSVAQVSPSHAETQQSSQKSFEGSGYSANRHQSQSGSKAGDYLPPENVHLRSSQEIKLDSHSLYGAPGYLPPEGSHHVSTGEPRQKIANHHAEYTNSGSEYLPPLNLHYENSATPREEAHHKTETSYNAPTSVSAGVPSHADFDKPDIEAASPNPQQYNINVGYASHQTYGIPNIFSQELSSVHLSPPLKQDIPYNLHNNVGNTLHQHTKAGQAHATSQTHAQQQQTYNSHQQAYSQQQQHSISQHQGYTSHSPLQNGQTYENRPIEYTAPTSLYLQNPATQYAAKASVYQNNNGYLPPHENEIINHKTSLHQSHSVNSNGYLPPIEKERPSEEDLSIDVRLGSSEAFTSGQNSSSYNNNGVSSIALSPQYANSYPSYSVSSNHDGYDYSKPDGILFEDGHNQQSNEQNLRVFDAGSQGGHQENVKIIRIIDESKDHSGNSNINSVRTLKIIKESVQSGLHQNAVQTIRIISEPPFIPPQISERSRVDKPPVLKESDEDLKFLRSTSAGENVEGGYLQPPSIKKSPIYNSQDVPLINSEVTIPTPSISNIQISHITNPRIAVPQIPSTQPAVFEITNQQILEHPPLLPSIRLRPPNPQHPAPQPAYVHRQSKQLKMFGIQNSPTVHSYLPPLSSAASVRPSSKVKLLRIVHENDQRQLQSGVSDAIYAGVAEQSGDEVNTIRVIHQQSASSEGRYAYPSPQVKTLKFYRKY